MIAKLGARVAWMRAHTCPCVFGNSGPGGKLPTPGSPVQNCLRCFGVGTYWDNPGPPFIGYVSFSHMSPTPDEPGVRMGDTYGIVQLSEPSLTIPSFNPNLSALDPAQPTTAWTNASTSDIFVMPDMQARFTAMLQQGGSINLPYQQNIAVAPSGAVTIWDPVSLTVSAVSGYVISGASVALPSGVYAPGQKYMVEFLAAPVYVAFRSAGGLPHVRPFGGGTVPEPKRFRLQALDYWTRQKSNTQPQAAGSSQAIGALVPFAVMHGEPH